MTTQTPATIWHTHAAVGLAATNKNADTRPRIAAPHAVIANPPRTCPNGAVTKAATAPANQITNAAIRIISPPLRILGRGTATTKNPQSLLGCRFQTFGGDEGSRTPDL